MGKMTQLYFSKVRRWTQNSIIIYEDGKLQTPILILVEADVERFIKEWETKL
jgi:hypothetical protein